MDDSSPPFRFSLRFIFVVVTIVCIWSAILSLAATTAVIISLTAGCLLYARGLAKDHSFSVMIGAVLMLLSLFAMPVLLHS
jgi:hypothetical protein